MFRHDHPADHHLLLARAHELEPHRQARVDAHLAACADCRQRSERLHTTLTRVEGDTPAAPDANGVDRTSRRRLQQAMQHAAYEADTGRRLRRVVRAAQLSLAAAAVVLGVGLAWSTVTFSGNTRDGLAAKAPALPNWGLTPGVVSDLDARALCSGERPSRIVSTVVRNQVLEDYGMRGVSEDTYELDALITPDLGGAAVRANLWPQRYSDMWNAHVKDALESLLATRVCHQNMPLATAQQALANDWVDAYQQYFHTSEPLPQHIAAIDRDDDVVVERRVAAYRQELRRLPLVLSVSCAACGH